MRFTIKQATSGSERVGAFTGFLKSPGAVIETPTSALFTQVFFLIEFFRIESISLMFKIVSDHSTDSNIVELLWIYLIIYYAFIFVRNKLSTYL